MAAGAVWTALVLMVWLVPRDHANTERAAVMADIHLSETSLPVGGLELVSTRWWGMMCLIATEGILFVYLIFSYAYLGSQSPGTWPPTGPPALRLSAPDTLVLLASSFLLAGACVEGSVKLACRSRSPAHLLSE